ncbi:MAG: sodium:proton antiporter [Gluconacetobacter diazotrophicus]|nr:sodium:proton antiporter [Gluconacetobacter diazotrophicus]
MTPVLRRIVFLVAVLALLPPFVHVAVHMPAFGDHPLPYGDLINRVGLVERHITNMISAINFDYRGFDTLGEEFMLLSAVTGTSILLRGSRGETDPDPQRMVGRRITPRSDALILACRLCGVSIVLFGFYLTAHGMLTPGGGFQAGVLIATGFLVVFLGEGYRAWRAVAPSEMFDAFEGAGAAAYALCGFASMLAGAPFLFNILPYGKTGDVFAGGLTQIENWGVTFAVCGGFGIVILEFLEETRRPQPADEAGGDASDDDQGAASDDDQGPAGGDAPADDPSRPTGA